MSDAGRACGGDLCAVKSTLVRTSQARHVREPARLAAQSCTYDTIGWGVALPNTTSGDGSGGGGFAPVVTGDLLCSQPGGCRCTVAAVSRPHSCAASGRIDDGMDCVGERSRMQHQHARIRTVGTLCCCVTFIIRVQ
jgi:hypothetical protein